MSVAKALGNGFPIGALLASEEVGVHLSSGTHGSTFGGNPLACAVALASLREIRAALPESRRVSQRLFESIDALRPGGRVAGVRGRGMLVGVLVRGVDAGEVMRAARARGLLVNAIGAEVIRLAPPLTLTAAEADEAVKRLSAALAAVPARG
jgi:acetylornithine/N-succinyldiaminopimelate aminotransferase